MQPSYQKGVVTQSSTYRTYPDVSADADPNTGVALYDSWDFGTSTPWCPGYMGGTSLACPLWAGMVAVADEGRQWPAWNRSTAPARPCRPCIKCPPTRRRTADFHDITSGNNGYAAGTGYDLASGIGSPVGNNLLPALAASYAPDLTVAMGNSTFKQGDSADTYTITVSNAGTVSTTGTVSLVDTLPTGLTATALSGMGWTVNLATLTATRSDALAAGSSYPALTLTVSVAANAPSSVTNTATVSGVEFNTSNDTASDVTSIAAANPTVTSDTPSTAGPTTATSLTYTVTFNQTVYNVVPSDFQLTATGWPSAR